MEFLHWSNSAGRLRGTAAGLRPSRLTSAAHSSSIGLFYNPVQSIFKTVPYVLKSVLCVYIRVTALGVVVLLDRNAKWLPTQVQTIPPNDLSTFRHTKLYNFPIWDQ